MRGPSRTRLSLVKHLKDVWFHSASFLQASQNDVWCCTSTCIFRFGYFLCPGRLYITGRHLNASCASNEQMPIPRGASLARLRVVLVAESLEIILWTSDLRVKICIKKCTWSIRFCWQTYANAWENCWCQVGRFATRCTTVGLSRLSQKYSLLSPLTCKMMMCGCLIEIKTLILVSTYRQPTRPLVDAHIICLYNLVWWFQVQLVKMSHAL